MRKAIAIFAATLALTAMGSLRPACAEKWALMVGINDYVAERIPDLRGCENDVKMLKQVLTERFGFPEANVRTIFSREATKERIVTEFNNWLIRQSKPGDVVLFHYSGHGSQAPDDNKDEEDGIDETICPTDIRTDQAFRDIRDEELGALIEKLQGRSVTVILDSCHSGTGTRSLDDSVSQFRIAPTENGQQLTTRARIVYRPQMFNGQADAPDGEGFALPGSRAAGDERAAMPYTLITGCRPDQTSADAPFQLDGGKYYYFGVLTFNLVSALTAVDPKDPSLTYQRIYDTITTGVKRRQFKQEPQLEGLKDARPFWASTAPVAPQVVQPAKPFILVSQVGGNRVAFNAGSMAGVTEKSVYTIYEATDNALEGPGIGLAQVTFVSATGCIAELKRADASKLKAGCRAVETVHYYPPNKLYVTVSDPDVTRRAAINKALGQIDFLMVNDKPGQYTDRVLRVQPAGGNLAGWLVDMDGQCVPAQSGASIDALVQALRKDLTNAYIIKRLTLLDNPSPAFQVKVWVDNGASRKIGDKVAFRFKANQDCYLNLIDCGTSGTVTVLFPNAWHKDNRIQANKEYSIPSAEMGFEIDTEGPAGREMVKAIATQKPLNLFGFDFNTLTQDNQPFLTRSVAQAVGGQGVMEDTVARSLNAGLEVARARDFRVRPTPPVTVQTPPPPAPPAPVVQTQVVEPPKPPVVVAAPPKPPATQQPVELNQNTVPTVGWATDSVVVDVRVK